MCRRDTLKNAKPFAKNLSIDKPDPHRIPVQFHGILQAELSHDAGPVVFHGLDADGQGVGDFPW
jgi:hypothetical protein